MNSKETDRLSGELIKLIAEGRFDPAKLQTALKPLRSNLSEAGLKSAIAALKKSGDEVSLQESFSEMGLSEEGARIAAKGKAADGDLEESLRTLGLSEEQARIAAKD